MQLSHGEAALLPGLAEHELPHRGGPHGRLADPSTFARCLPAVGNTAQVDHTDWHPTMTTVTIKSVSPSRVGRQYFLECPRYLRYSLGDSDASGVSQNSATGSRNIDGEPEYEIQRRSRARLMAT